MKGKPILSLDFDGVIHSYTSGWKGPRAIPDPPVDGALEFIVRAIECFDVQIYSSRSRYFGGISAMRGWLRYHYCEIAWDKLVTPDWLYERIERRPAVCGFEEWRKMVRRAVDSILKQIGFPRHKPPAMVTLDDRAVTFTGQWPSIDELAAFKPWYK